MSKSSSVCLKLQKLTCDHCLKYSSLKKYPSCFTNKKVWCTTLKAGLPKLNFITTHLQKYKYIIPPC